MIAYILATCVPGSEKTTITEIKKMPNVNEVNGIMGRYDIFVKVSAESPKDIDATIYNIRNVQQITSTFSMSVIYGEGGTVDNER